MSDSCRSCHAPIWWAETMAGKSIPINEGDDPAGNLRVTSIDLFGNTRVGYIKTGEVWEGARYTSHFATCPEGDFWRRRS